jgi:hypothetical protein
MTLLYEQREIGRDDSGDPVIGEVAVGYADKYVKAPGTLRSFVGSEEQMVALLFDHDLDAICEFRYAAAG